MTSDKIRKVREAAELLHDWEHPNPIKYKAMHPWEVHINDFDLEDEKDIAALAVCEVTLSLVGTDGEDSVNEEWLVAAFGLEKVFETESTIKLQLETEKEWHDIYIRKHKNVIEIFGETSGVKCNNSIANCTRYQFRLLAAALGIKRKGE